MQLNRIRAISFDLDDTLWPFQRCLVRAEAALVAWLRANAPGTGVLLDVPTSLRDYRAQAEIEHPHLRTDLSGLRREAIRSMLAAADEDVALAETAFEVFFEERLRVELYDDVLPALARLSARYPLVGLSNGNGCIHKAGVGAFFKGSLSAAALGVAKPEAAAFHAAATLAGVQAGELLHVGDDWHFDVVGAVGAGAQAVWVMRADLVRLHEGPAFDTDGTAHTAVEDLLRLCDALGV